MLELERPVGALDDAIPPGPLVVVRLTGGRVLVLDLAEGEQLAVVGAEGVDAHDRVVAVGDVGEELRAEGEDGLRPFVLLACELVDAVGGEEVC